jgi:AraC-like DNA-binding protein
MGLILYFRTKPKKQNNSVTINYQAVPFEHKPKSKKSFLEYINENFANSELSLHLISEQTGITQRNIAESISTQFNCNLKTYINQIRINEAQRLLKETDLNISEIAYKVGFSSPSNFNRVFKNLTGENPSEFLLDKN